MPYWMFLCLYILKIVNSMKIIHTADLHLGQIIYQNYERSDEHAHFFRQLKNWCREEKPDALLVSGDVFDIQQPSAATKQNFTNYFVDLHRQCPDMAIVIVAGNHDSASRIQADSAVWMLGNTYLIGSSPATDVEEGWQDNYIIRLKSGYIVAMPYMMGNRKDQIQSVLDRVTAENTERKPVVMMAHTAVTGLDITGHSFEIGKLKTQETETLGCGYDYLALGHIHKPQTIGYMADFMLEEVTYPAPVIRYSGSALHVSCDEAYPHTVSVVEIDQHEGNVSIRQLRIDELRHFYTLPMSGGVFVDADEAIREIECFAQTHGRGYIQLQMDYKIILPSDFNQQVYDVLAPYNEEIRYNPKIRWIGTPAKAEGDEKLVFEVAELQQMTDPMTFIEKTIGQYPGFGLEELREAFEEVKVEVERLREQEQFAAKARQLKKKMADKI